ncbi:hypothetical protein ACFU7Z_21745 [Kitasatospora sp. NPDC057518]|uniref:hypothetical protein n=1 Tax=Kitasatospora sp. NPDC057518 TaxID=3346155 RepID=UPI00369723FE
MPTSATPAGHDKTMRWTVHETETGWSKDHRYNWSLKSAPAIEAYKGLLHCFAAGALEPYGLAWGYYNKETDTWYSKSFVYDVEKNPVHTSGPLAVQHANDFLYCVHHRAKDDRRLWWTRYNSEGPETGWSLHQPVKDHRSAEVRSTRPAALTVYGGLLYCVHDGDGILRWITHDTATKTWGTDLPIPGDIRAVRAPAIERFKDHLYCVHDRGGDDLYWITYNSGTQEWSADRRIEDAEGNPVRTSHAPAIARHNDYLYCVYYVDTDSGRGELWWTRYDDSDEGDDSWSVPERIPDVRSYTGFDIAPYYGGLYCVHEV